jgi:hypothetical protein
MILSIELASGTTSLKKSSLNDSGKIKFVSEISLSHPEPALASSTAYPVVT